jgi:hypothetical protein
MDDDELINLLVCAVRRIHIDHRIETEQIRFDSLLYFVNMAEDCSTSLAI